MQATQRVNKVLSELNSDLAEIIAEFDADRLARRRRVCSPPAAKTESIQGLAALVDSGQAGGTTTKSNAGPWRSIAEFLDAQHLASFGLRCLSAEESAAQAAVSASVAAAAAGPRVAHPVGNTGYTSQPLPVRHGEALPAPFGASHRG